MPNKKWFEGISNERLKVLIAPFKNREVNEMNYDSKMKFWKDSIISTCDQRHRCSFFMGELKTWFSYNEHSPLCLLTVVEDMFREGIIKSRSNFEQMTSQKYNNWLSWAVNILIKSLLLWGVGRIKESFLSPTTVIDEKSEYIILQLVENQANELFNKTAVNEHSQIFWIDDLQKRLYNIWNEDVTMSSTELLVHSLEIRNKVCVERGEHLVEAHKTLVKIASFGKDVELISELEKNFFKLKETEKILISEINNMDIEKQSLTNVARSYIVKNMKLIALTYLRKKKEMEKRIEKHLKYLDNAQALISLVEESKFNSEIMKSYGHGLAALKLSAKETGLTIDNVDETMAELAEVIEVHRDMQSAISSLGGFADVNQNEEELEDELADLFNKDKPKVSRKEKHYIPDFPNIPDGSFEGEEVVVHQKSELLNGN